MDADFTHRPSAATKFDSHKATKPQREDCINAISDLAISVASCEIQVLLPKGLMQRVRFSAPQAQDAGKVAYLWVGRAGSLEDPVVWRYIGAIGTPRSMLPQGPVHSKAKALSYHAGTQRTPRRKGRCAGWAVPARVSYQRSSPFICGFKVDYGLTCHWRIGDHENCTSNLDDVSIGPACSRQIQRRDG